MGTLAYNGTQAEFNDRLLAHLHVVIINKFTANEAFALSWLRAVSLGSGRVSMWMVPTAPVTFRFLGSKAPDISRTWIQQLSTSAASSRGLVVTNEDGTLAREGATGDDVQQHVSRAA